MRAWTVEQVAAAAGADVVRGARGGPARAVVDSRAVRAGDLFVGLRGAQVDGAGFADAALGAGAWGVLVGRGAPLPDGEGAVLAADDPLAALGALARAWRRELGATVIAVTGSVGKTSTKDLIAAMAAPHRVVAASRANFNTEIGLPLELLAAPRRTELVVLELAMRGFGQIAELTAVCEPDVGVITNVAPVHLEQVGSLEGVARAKGELLVGMRDGATAVVPADEPLLAPWLRPGLGVLRFGPGGDVDFLAGRTQIAIPDGEPLVLELPSAAWRNAPAAAAACVAAGVRPAGRVELAPAALRGERVALALGATVINDCYNASPLSMRAALDDLATQDPGGRRVAVLGDMRELGPDAERYHREIGAHASATGVELLVTVGPLAATMLDAFDGEGHAVADAGEAAALAGELLRPGDLVLVKGSRGVGLEVVAEALLATEAITHTGRGR
jgi:UDP-N-acetylmuramoyl-tripeptide--D-alanyl-D-alanine ligase